MNANATSIVRCLCVLLTLLASPAWAAGITSVHTALAALGGLGDPPPSSAYDAGGPRKECEQLVKQARTALGENRLDQAEQLLVKAERLGVKYDPVSAKIGDTPEKVRRDLETAKSAGKKNGAVSRLPALLPSQPRDAQASRAAADNAIANMTDDAKARAKQWLETGRKALAQGNVVEAQAAYQKALGAKATFAPGEYSPEQLAAELKLAGVNTAQLAPATSPSPFTLRPSDVPNDADHYPEARTPSSPAQYQNVFGNGDVNPNNLPKDRNPLTAPSPKTAAALDGGDFPAPGMNDQAANAPARPQPNTQEELAPVINRLPRVDSAVRPATGTQDKPGEYPVSRGVYDPRRDNSRVVPVQGEGLAAPPNGALKAEKLYNAGLDALQQGDRQGALGKFQEAWKFADQLDPQTRQDLKDKLSLLRVAPSAAPATPAPAEEIDPQQSLRYQKLLGEIASEKQAAEKLANEDPRQALSNMKALRQRIVEADLHPQGRKVLLTSVDRYTKEIETFIERNRGDIELREANNEVKAQIAREQEFKVKTQQKIAELVDKFNQLMDEQRFPEAEVIAKQVRELDPESSIAQQLTWKVHFASSLASSMGIQSEKERKFVGTLGSVEESSIPFDDRNPIQFDARNWAQLTKTRREKEMEVGRRLNPAEKEIEKSLSKPVEVNFENRPLSDVLDVLSKMAGINIHLDPQGLHAEAVTSDTPVTFKTPNPIMLKSALNIILGEHQLSYVIQDEVLLITSRDRKDAKTFTKVYYVADLVTPIPNFVPSYNIGLPGAIRESFNAMGYGMGGLRPGFGGTVPMTLGQNEANGQTQQNPSVMAQFAASQMQGPNGSPIPLPAPGTRSPQMLGGGPGGLGGGVIADFDTLIDLITSTISPDSWTDNGGQGSISGFPTNLSLVVSQTQDIHADIADLLQQLRRLQDLQVTIEVRFITLNDNFFERIGVDFDFRIDDNSGLNPANPVIPDDNGSSYVVGLGPNGQPTRDLDLVFNQDTFASAVPQFGGFDVTNAANFGFAILSDIEVFFLLQALQGDTRTNVLQAPKVTLFNGQQAFVRDSTDRPFVTQIIPVVGDFAAAQQPVVTVLSEGTSLSVQAVVSSDRRFVRLTLVPMFTKIGDVSTFTFSGKTTSNTGTTVQDPTDPTKKVTNNEQTTTEGTTVQLPSLGVTTVSTTVSVPDGGTVLLGGIKRLQEGRNERGIPLLSKLPYISRLFKNVGIGRTTQSLMMMVTPRIIIQEEEEDKLGLGIER